MYKERRYPCTNEKHTVVMTVSMEHAGKVEGRVRPGTGEIEIRIKTPDTEAGGDYKENSCKKDKKESDRNASRCNRVRIMPCRRRNG